MPHPAIIMTAALLAGAVPSTTPETPEKLQKETAKVPEGFVEMFVAGVLPTDGGPAVVLRDRSEKTLLPIWIGMSEAHSIQLRLDRRRFPRPLTHDLLDAVMQNLGGELLKIQVDDFKGDTFVGTIFVRKGDKVQHFDARPSDSIALAVGNQVPIFVSRAVIDRLSTKREEGKEPEIKEDAVRDDPEEGEDGPSRPMVPPSAIQTM